MVEILFRLISLLSAPPGDLVYHLVILFVLEAIVLIGTSTPRNGSTAFKAALLAPLAGRIALFAAALLALAGLASADGLLPPLERFVDTVSLGLLLWVFIPLAAELPRASANLVIGNVVLGALAYVIFAKTWYDQISLDRTSQFNDSSQDWVWTFWALGILGIAFLAQSARRRPGWGMLGAASAAFFAGYLLHIGIGEASSHAPGWVRLGNLVAYPLLAGVMLRRVLDSAAQHVTASAAPNESAVFWHTLEMCRSVMSASDLGSALQHAIVAINATLNADAGAIGIILPDKRSIELAAVQQTNQPPGAGPTFTIHSQPAIHRAIALQQPMRLENMPGPRTLPGVLNGNIRSLYVQPFVQGYETLGVLIVGRHTSQEWSDAEQRALDIFAAELAEAITQQRRVDRLANDLAQHAIMLRQEREQAALLAAELDAQVAKLKNERDELTARLDQVQAALEQAQCAPAQAAALPADASPFPNPLEPEKANDEATMLKADNVDLSAYRRQFFEEATKQMDALGHALERLRETQNKDALVQLFRATASLKGMATTMNYTMLTRLAALLNDTAKRLRGGELAPHPSLLLLAQDTLNVMRVLLEDIHGGLRRPSVDVAPLLERWGPFIVHAPSPQTASVSVTPSPVLQARVQLSPRCQLKAVRAMVILAQLRRIGKVLSCQPDEPTLRTGHIQGEFFVMLTTGRSPAEVQAMLESLGDVTQAEVRYLRVP